MNDNRNDDRTRNSAHAGTYQRTNLDARIRKTSRSDSDRILAIRNHPAVRNTSINTAEIASTSHSAWFERMYLRDDTNACFIIETDGLVVGYCRFDRQDDGSYLSSIAIDQEYHGRGYGSMLLSGSLGEFAPGKKIVAEILKGNEVSLKLFQARGFRLTGEDERMHYLQFERPS